MLTMPQCGGIHCQQHPKHHLTQESLTPAFDSRAAPTLSQQANTGNWNIPQPHHRAGKAWENDSNEQDRPHREKLRKEREASTTRVTPDLRGKPKEQRDGILLAWHEFQQF